MFVLIEKCPEYDFGDILKKSICLEQSTQAWCENCEKYQPTVSLFLSHWIFSELLRHSPVEVWVLIGQKVSILFIYLFYRYSDSHSDFKVYINALVSVPMVSIVITYTGICLSYTTHCCMCVIVDMVKVSLRSIQCKTLCETLSHHHAFYFCVNFKREKNEKGTIVRSCFNLWKFHNINITLSS